MNPSVELIVRRPSWLAPLTRRARLTCLLRILLTCLLACLGLPGLAGCDASTPDSAPGTRSAARVHVLASVYPLADLSGSVGGSHVDVEWAVESGRRPEEAGSVPDLKQRMARAQIIVTAGPWDAWAGADLAADARGTRLVEVSRMPSVRRLAAPGGPGGPAVQVEDAYFWLDPVVAEDVVEAVRERLAVADPDHTADYRERAAAVRKELVRLAGDLRLAGSRGRGDGAGGPGGGSRRKVLLARPVWGPMVVRAGLEPIAPVRAEEDRWTEADLSAIARAAREHRLDAVYVNVAAPIGVRQRIAERTGLRVLTLDALGTSAPAGRSTYRAIIEYNAAQLAK